MEPIRVRGSLRCHWVRRIRACNRHSANAATADSSFDAARKNIFACLSHLRTRAKLDLFAAALAQLLAIKRDGCQAVNISIDGRPSRRSLKTSATGAQLQNLCPSVSICG